MQEKMDNAATIGIAIPTYQREKELEKAINHILGQTNTPDTVAIIDDGSLSFSKIEEWKINFEKKSIKFIYYKKDHTREKMGLSESKNIAIKILPTDNILFIDDDIYLEKDALLNIRQILQKKTSDNYLIGVAGIITNNRRISNIEKIYNKIFLLSSQNEWDITKTGFQVWNDNIKVETVAYYSHGGLTTYRREFLKTHEFPVFSSGRTGLEDVSVAALAKAEGYHLIVSPNIKAYHDTSSTSREADHISGKKETQNRKNIFNSLYPNPSIKIKLSFSWSLTGWILRQFIAGHIGKGIGMIAGIF